MLDVFSRGSQAGLLIGSAVIGSALMVVGCGDLLTSSNQISAGRTSMDAEAGPEAGEEDEGRPDGPSTDGARADAARADAASADGASTDGARADGPLSDAERADDFTVPTPQREAGLEVSVDGGPSDREPMGDVHALTDAERSSDVADVAAAHDAPALPDAALAPLDLGPCRPEVERCDGRDQDCDGETDEDFEIGARCDGEGLCGVGRLECDEDGGTRCSTEPGGSGDESNVEACNGADDDCDGDSDERPESIWPACYEGEPGTVGLGRCVNGHRSCVDGVPIGPCLDQVLPGVESCNALDDDCDGRTDERLPVEALCGQGVCRPTSTPSACLEGEIVACLPGPVLGDDSVCNARDEDCDGRTDEGYVIIQRCGLGDCAAMATPSRCQDGLELRCVPGAAAPTDRFCDGVDEDCDGRGDEDWSGENACGLGECRRAARPAICVNGLETACQPGPPAESDASCNVRDEDCDGRVDEAYLRVGGCGRGVCALTEVPSRCVAGVETLCQPGSPASLGDETCDGLDTDCDGREDEDFASDAACGIGACAVRPIASTCIDGVETACLPGPPLALTDVTCDGVDDDCNGAADEEAPVIAPGGERRITAAAGDSIRPQADRSGDGLAVVFSDTRTGRNLIYFAKLDATGARIGDEVLVTQMLGSNTNAALATVPDGYVVVWQGTSTGRPQIYASVLNAQGSPVFGSSDFRINQVFDAATLPKIAYTGNDLYVVWQQGPSLVDVDIFSRRLAANGTLNGDEVNLTNTLTASVTPSIVWNAARAELAVTFTEVEPVAGAYNVYFTRVQNGARQGGLVKLTHADENESSPSIAASNVGYAVAWQDTRGTQDIYLQRLDALGAAVGPEIAVGAAPLVSAAPHLAWDGVGYGVSWFDNRNGNDNAEIYFARVSAAGLSGRAERLSSAAGNSFLPWMTYLNGGYVALWYDHRDGNAEIYFTRGPFGCP